MNVLQYHKIKPTGPYTSKVAKEMKMTANMKSGSYSRKVDGVITEVRLFVLPDSTPDC